MGTNVEIKVVAKDSTKANDAIQSAFKEIERIEKIASNFNKDSELSQLNLKGFSSHPELFDIINKSMDYAKLTEGAFDITVYPLTKLWGFNTDTSEGTGIPQGKYKVPTDKEIKDTLEIVGYERIKLDYKNKKVYLNRSKLDLGGIAKGFAVDKAINILRERGIRKALVNAGGDIKFIGNKKWRIGIQHPRLKDKLITTIKLKNKAIVTSGDYERYFMINEHRYQHIINPITGYPATECISVTIIADDATDADALATGVVVLGPDKGMKLINKLKNIEGLIIDSEGNIITSQGLKNLKGGRIK